MIFKAPLIFDFVLLIFVLFNFVLIIVLFLIEPLNIFYETTLSLEMSFDGDV